MNLENLKNLVNIENDKTIQMNVLETFVNLFKKIISNDVNYTSPKEFKVNKCLFFDL